MAVQQAGELLQSVVEGYAAARPAELAEAAAVEAAACREYMHAASRHLYYMRATLQLLLRQLRFCGAEMHGASRHRNTYINVCIYMDLRWI